MRSRFSGFASSSSLGPLALLVVCAASLVATRPTAAEGVAAVMGRVEAGAPASADVTVELVPVESRYDETLRVFTGEGEEPQPVDSTTTGEDGRWKLTASSGVYRLRATPPAESGLPSYRYWLVRLTSEFFPEPLEPEGADERRVTVTADGRPVSGALVRVDSQRVGFVNWQQATQWLRTDEHGMATFAVDTGQRLEISVAADGFAVASESGDKDLRVELQAAAPREVRVEDSAGQAVAGVLLVADGLPVALSGEDGLATVHVPADGLRLEALGQGGESGSARVDPPATDEDANAEPRAITLNPRRVVAGRVIDAESREPVAGALVWQSFGRGLPTARALAAGRGAEIFALTDGAGAYELAMSDDPGLHVAAQAAGYHPATSELRGDEPVAPTVALRPASSLRGSVVNSAGEPVEGAEVSAVVKPEGPSMRFGGQVQKAQTEASGSFVVRSLEPGAAYRLEATADGYAPGGAEARTGQPGDPTSRPEPVEITLGRGAQAFGRVVDESDQPVAGATVELESQGSGDPMEMMRRMMLDVPPAGEATSDADGMFSFRHVAAGSYRMSAKAPGFAAASVPGIELTEGAEEIDLGTLVLSPGVKVHGVVVDSAGQGLEGAEIRMTVQQGGAMMRVFTSPRGPADATSGSDGGFELVDLAPDDQVSISASLTGYQRGSVDGVRAPNDEPARIVLRKSAEIRGRVVDDTGLPVEGADVGVAISRNRGPISRFHEVGSATSDADGTFELLDAPIGSARLKAEAEGFQAAEKSVELQEGERLDDIELVLRPGARIVGTVTDSEGVPVVDAAVAVEDEGAAGNPMRMMFGGGGARTDGDGTFLLDGLESGRQTIIAVKDSQRASRVLEVKSGTNRLDLRFSTGASVSGRVVDPDGLPAADVHLTLQGTEDFTLRFTTTSRADGTFLFDDVAPGSYRLVGEASGRATSHRPDPVTVAAQPVSGVELRMQRGQVLTGQLLGADFDDVSSAQVIAMSNVGFIAGKVDFEGGYRVEGMGPGHWTVRGSLADGRQATETVEIEEGLPETVLDLDFDAGERLVGEAVSESGPAQGVRVSAVGLDVNASGFEQTDTAGRFEFQGLEPGRYRIIAYETREGLTAEQEADVPGPEVRLELESISLEGRVRDAWDGSNVSGAQIRAEIESDKATEGSSFFLRGRNITTDDDGLFRLGGLTLGTWKLEVTKTGYATQNRTVEILGDGTSVDITLERSDGMWLTVRRSDGAAVSKVQMLALDAGGGRVAGGEFVPDEAGRVYVSTVPPGSFRLIVQAPGTGPTELDVRVPDDRPDVLLEAGGRVLIEVPELASDPVRADAVLTRGGQPLRTLFFGGQILERFRLRGGRGDVGGVSAGTWTVTVTAADGRTWSGRVEVAGGSQQTVQLE